MTEPDNIVLEMLRRIGDDVAETKLNVRELTGRVGNLEIKFAHVEMQLASQSVRIDRLSDKFDRICARLDIVDHSI